MAWSTVDWSTIIVGTCCTPRSPGLLKTNTNTLTISNISNLPCSSWGSSYPSTSIESPRGNSYKTGRWSMLSTNTSTRKIRLPLRKILVRAMVIACILMLRFQAYKINILVMPQQSLLQLCTTSNPFSSVLIRWLQVTQSLSSNLLVRPAKIIGSGINLFGKTTVVWTLHLLA